MRSIGFLLVFVASVGAQETVPGRVLVRYRAQPRAVKLDGVRVSETLARLRRDPNVLYAEPDYVRYRSGQPVTPNDPMYSSQWALPMIRAPQAWSRTTGSANLTIAVIDSGIIAHPDLAGRVAGGYDFISDPSNANDGDGRDADPTDTGDASDASSALHGTHVAGILGAATNNGVGIAGLDWAARVVPVRVLGIRRGSGVDSDISDAIRWAAGLHVDGVPDNPFPADVINMSFGGKGTSQTMQAAIDDAIARGAIVVAAAGNTMYEASQDSPAGLNGVITVGAADPTSQLAPYSNYGPAVSLLAPGGLLRNDANGNPEGILSTIALSSGYTYAYYAGTSQATPFVSATLTLMKAVYPTMAPAEAKKLLLASADPVSRCADPTDATMPGCGAGLLDVDAAVVLAATQSQCSPVCGDGLVCHAGQCVSASSIAGGADGAGNVTVGGCSTSGGGPLDLAANLAFALVLVLAVRRGCRV
jgi:serine protease